MTATASSGGRPGTAARALAAARCAAPPSSADAGVEGSIRALYQAIELGNFDVLGECFHEQAVYRRPGGAPIVSRARIIDYYRRDRAVATSRILVETIVSQGAHAVAMGLVEGRGREGEPVHEQFADVYEFAEGAVTRRTTYFFRHGF